MVGYTIDANRWLYNATSVQLLAAKSAWKELPLAENVYLLHFSFLFGPQFLGVTTLHKKFSKPVTSPLALF